MLDKLVISNDGSVPEKGRKNYFAISSAVVSFALLLGLVVNLFSQNMSLGDDFFNISTLVAPQMPPAQPEQPELKRMSTGRSASGEQKLATRKVNMLRVDEQPKSIPDSISSDSPQNMARPNSAFTLGNSDTNSFGSKTLSNDRCEKDCGSEIGSDRPKEVKSDVNKIEAKRPTVGVPPPLPEKRKDTAPKTIRKSIVLNGSAKHLVKPTYDALMRNAGARGRVTVEILINEEGTVVSAHAIDGHPLFRKPSESAALRSKFSPTILGDSPVKVSGVIIYNFN